MPAFLLILMLCPSPPSLYCTARHHKNFTTFLGGGEEEGWGHVPDMPCLHLAFPLLPLLAEKAVTLSLSLSLSSPWLWHLLALTPYLPFPLPFPLQNRGNI